MSGNLLWYVTRGAGIASLLMLTGVVTLGILTATRWQRPSWPRFLTAELHRSLSLLTLVFLAIHVAVAVADPYTSLGWLAVVAPFLVRYKRLWLGLGGVALYLIAAIVVTSLLRRHLGQRAWRAIHWLTYAAWPIALVHGIGTGSDSAAIWMWALDGACIATVVAAAAWRVAGADDRTTAVDRALPPARRTELGR